MKALLVSLLLPLLLAGCTLLDFGGDEETITGPAGIHEGLFTLGIEDSVFEPCGRRERWWVTGDDDALRTLAGAYVEAGNRVIFARVRGTVLTGGDYGNFDRFEKALEIASVEVARPLRVGDCR